MEINDKLTLLREAVETTIGRKMQTPRDFEYLAQKIFDTQHENISSTTLKRLWGYLPEPSMPSLRTLNLLARLVDCNDWKDFCHNCLSVPPVTEEEKDDLPEVTPVKNSRSHLLLPILIAILAVSVGIALWIHTYIHHRDTATNDYVLLAGQDFSSPDQYFAIFGVQEPDSLWWVQPMPHRLNIIIWTPEYQNAHYHNLGNPDSLYPTITEHWEPIGCDCKPALPEVVNMRNKERYIAARQTNVLRICFMKHLRPERYTFLGVYRLWLERSDTTQLTWQRVADKVDLNNLNYLEQLR